MTGEYTIRYSHPTGDGTMRVAAPGPAEARTAALSHLLETRGREWCEAITWEDQRDWSRGTFRPECPLCGGYLLPCTATATGIHPGLPTR
jgi:hypothetical protein